MAVRPLVFGARLKDGSRSLRVRARADDPRRYVVEEVRPGGRRRERQHDSLAGALRDLASSWRARLG